MVKAKCTDILTFAQPLYAASTLLEDAVIQATPQGLSLYGMDPSHVAMLNTTLKKDIFEEYELATESESFGLRLDEITKILKRAPKKSPLNFDTGDKSKLSLSFSGNRTYGLRLIGVGVGGGDETEEQQDKRIPKINYSYLVSFNTTESFLRIACDIQCVSEYITFKTDSEQKEDELKITGIGESGSCEIDLGLDEITLEKLNNKEEGKELDTTFSLEYIIPFCKSLSKEQPLKFYMASAKPLKIVVESALGGILEFYLAPRVES